MKPNLFFDPWQTVVAASKEVSAWQSAQAAVNAIIEIATDDRELAWRGVHDASFALHSSLYRRMKNLRGAPPDENDLIDFEKQLLGRARQDWRYDNMTSLELLANMQHFGGPTRLLDVSFNPFIALWFAVEEQHDKDGRPIADVDGRIFAFDVTGRHVELDDRWNARELPWETRPTTTWRTGMPLLWRPPSLNDRIPAQNSAFLIGGVPSVRSGGGSVYRKEPVRGTGGGTWTAREVRDATSVVVRMNTTKRKLQLNATPTFTVRIEAAVKKEIRFSLEKRFGYNKASVYPDLFGLGQHSALGLK